MAKEIERKFLVINDSYKEMAYSVDEITQAYLCDRPESTVRLRIRNNEGFITVKSKNRGATRHEWEYPINSKDIREMLENCHTDGIILQKRRYNIVFCGQKWEVDEFIGDLSPLILAEIELTHENEELSLPPFIGEEVTGRPEFYNSSLASAIKSRK